MELDRPVQINRKFVYGQIIIGVLAAIATILMALLIPGLIEQRNELKAEAAKLEKQVIQMDKDIEGRRLLIEKLEKDEKEAVIRKEQALKEAADATARLELVAARLEEREYDVAKQIAIKSNLNNETSLTTTLSPRVYIHIRNDNQAKLAEQITESLKKMRVIVPGTEILVEKGPTQSELRYFRRTERKQAEKIYNSLRSSFPDANWKNEPIYIPEYEDSKAIRANHFELWLAPTA